MFTLYIFLWILKSVTSAKICTARKYLSLQYFFLSGLMTQLGYSKCNLTFTSNVNIIIKRFLFINFINIICFGQKIFPPGDGYPDLVRKHSISNLIDGIN